MALLDAKEFQFGRQNVWATDSGVADIPSTNTSGVIQLGDIILNISGAIGAPAYWVCTTAGSSPVFTAAGVTGSSSARRSVAGSATLATTDRYLFITAAGTVTLPAPSAALAAHTYTLKVTAQPVTVSTASGSLDGSATPGSITLSSQQTVDLLTDATNWFSIGKDTEFQVLTASPPATLSVKDRYVLCAAGALTVPVGTAWVIGHPLTVTATASSVTITPASGNIGSVAAVTLTINQTATLYTDGTNIFRAA